MYPKSILAGLASVAIIGVVSLNYFGVTFGLSKFFASDPSEMSCGELGGNYCSQEGFCPDGASDLGVTTDCNPCCQEAQAPSETPPEATPEPTSEENPEATPEPTPDDEVLGSIDPCADGDCDGDGFNNPVVGGNDCDDGNANVFPGSGCPGDAEPASTAAPASTATPQPASTATTAPEVDPCADGDCDGDGYNNPVVGGNDCDDGNAALYPGNGCSVQPESTATPVSQVPTPAPSTPPGVDPCADGDCDGDGYNNPVVGGNDCDDGNAALYPGSGCPSGATPTPMIAASTSPTATASPSVDPCADGDCDGDGYLNPVVGGNDCNDGDASLYPGAGCPGTTPINTATPLATSSTPTPIASATPTIDPCADGDCDGDGYNNPVIPGGNDCDDSNPTIYPGQGCAGIATPTPTPTGTPTPTPTQNSLAVDSPCLDADCDNDNNVRPSRTDAADGADCNDLDRAITFQGFDCDGDGVFNLQKPGITVATADCNDFDATKRTECRATSSVPLILSFRSDVARVSQGQSAQVTWDVRDATSCTGEGFVATSATSGTASVGPLQSTTSVTLTCSNANGNTLKTIEILVDAPASHLECVNNTCSAVAGNGANACNSAGASCQGGASGASYTDLVNWFRGQGVQISGQFGAPCLDTVKTWIGRMGSKGNLNKIDNNVGGGADAQMASNGVMGLKDGNCSAYLVAHELIHALIFADGGLRSGAENIFNQSGKRSITKGSDASRNSSEMAAYGAGWFVGGWRSNLVEHAREMSLIAQFNFIAGLPGINESPIAQAKNLFRGLASVFSSIFDAGEVQNSVLAVDGTPPPEFGTDGVHISGPAISLLSHQNGETVTSSPVTISGEVSSDILTSAPIQKIRIEINRIFATDVTPSSSACAGGISNCAVWSVALQLKEGANEIRAIATDTDGIESVPLAIIINIPGGAGSAVSGATDTSIVTTPLLAISSTQGTSQGSVGRVATVATGPGTAALVALLSAGIASLLYVGYTGTNRFRRREAQGIAKDNIAHHETDFRS